MVVNYERILSDNLKRMGIRRPERLYDFLDRLGERSDIGDYTLDLTTTLPSIVAEYKGGKKISDPRAGGGRRPIPDKVARNVKGIFRSLPVVDGVVLGRVFPSLTDNECYGNILLDGKLIQIVLKGTG